MSFREDKRTLDELVAQQYSVLQTLGRLRVPDSTAIATLTEAAEAYCPALEAAAHWKGSRMKSLQAGIAAAHTMREMLEHKAHVLGKMLVLQFESAYQQLAQYPTASAYAAITDIAKRYAQLRAVGGTPYLPLVRFIAYLREREKMGAQSTHQIAAHYRDRDATHVQLYTTMHAQDVTPQPSVQRRPAQLPKRDILVWVEGTADGVWEDIARLLHTDPVLYRCAQLARVPFPAADIPCVMGKLEQLLPKLRERNAGVYAAPASIVCIPELMAWASRAQMPWFPKPVHRRYTHNVDFYNLNNIGAPAAWRTTRGEGSSIAVIDTGVDYAHSELLDRFGTLRGYNFVDDTNDPMDDNEHGTHVGGTVAGKTRGVAPAAQLFALKVLNAEGYGSMADVLRAMEWVMDYNSSNAGKICAVNLSLGASEPNPIEERMCKRLYESGVALIAAAGNERRGPSYPASYAKVISVAAVDRWNEHAGFSNIWNTTDISAPGVNVNSCVPGGYASFSGTSMATPHISGIAALAYSAGWNPGTFEKLLKQRAQGIGMGEDERNGKYGAGLGRADRMVGQEVAYGKMVCGL